jgi:hypothetical protein
MSGSVEPTQTDDIPVRRDPLLVVALCEIVRGLSK